MKLKYIGKHPLIMTEFKGGKLVNPQEVVEFSVEEYNNIVALYGIYLQPVDEKAK